MAFLMLKQQNLGNEKDFSEEKSFWCLLNFVNVLLSEPFVRPLKVELTNDDVKDEQ